MKFSISFIILSLIIASCNDNQNFYEVDRGAYIDKLEGFWLGQCIGNWTGLITEMDKIGVPVDGKAGGFYTREDWGKRDQPNFWGSNNYSQHIDYFFAEKDSIWGSDDDTDIEYIYQELLYNGESLDFTGEDIKKAWMTHIHHEEENFLWVSNQKAFDLMNQGIVPPETSNPDINPYYEMIDAQLTTEIFGLFAPTKPKIALDLSYLPIRTTARENAADIAEFYIIMHSLASKNTNHRSIKDKILWMAKTARSHLSDKKYPAKMFDFVYQKYCDQIPWEDARDELNFRYQIQNMDNYLWSKKDKTCNGCFAAGINFGASLISLLYGEGDLKETIKIGALAGWDSDNPTSTWGGLIGFMLGKKKVEEIFGRKFSTSFNIHRTRRGFSNGGIDNFRNMALKGQNIVDKVVLKKMSGLIDTTNNKWLIPSE